MLEDVQAQDGVECPGDVLDRALDDLDVSLDLRNAFAQARQQRGIRLDRDHLAPVCRQAREGSDAGAGVENAPAEVGPRTFEEPRVVGLGALHPAERLALRVSQGSAGRALKPTAMLPRRLRALREPAAVQDARQAAEPVQHVLAVRIPPGTATPPGVPVGELHLRALVQPVLRVRTAEAGALVSTPRRLAGAYEYCRSFVQTEPACSAEATREARSRSRVQTLALRPNGESFVSWTASRSSLNGWTATTGPKISSRVSAASPPTPVSTVGS